MKSVKANKNNNEYSAVCPYCSKQNIVELIPQKIRVVQLKSVCKNYLDIDTESVNMKFKEVIK